MILLFLFWVLGVFYLVYRGTKLYGFTDKPDGLLKDHEKATSIGGGMAIILIYTISCLFSPLNTMFNLYDLVTIWSVFILGLIDDKFRLGYTIKLLVQVIIVSLYVYYQGTSSFFIGFSLVTALVILMNSINIIDNYNGVSGFLYTYSILILSFSLNYEWTTAFVLLFPLVVFLFFNHRSPGNSLMFMGNNGSYSFGMIISILFLKSTMATLDNSPSLQIFDILSFAGVVFLPFIVDTLVVMIVRFYRGMNPLKGSHDHLSHILLDFDVKPIMIAPVLFLFFVMIAGIALLVPHGIIRFVWVALNAVLLIFILVNYRIKLKYAK